MKAITAWVSLCLGGMVLSFIGGYMGGFNGMILGMFGGILPFMAIMQMIAFFKNKKLLALLKTLNDDEKYMWLPDKRDKLHLMVMKEPHPGILVKKGLGIFEHKGTEFGLGKDGMCFAYPDGAYTVDFKTIDYASKLEKEDGLDEYEDIVKEYLGENMYKVFCSKFRTNPKPDYFNIDNEIQWLINNKPKDNNGKDNDDEDKLCKTVFGTTVDFTNRLKFLRYNYNPISGENATERERIIALKEGMDYKEDNKEINRAKGIAMILFAAMIFIAVLVSLDWSGFINMFGG